MNLHCEHEQSVLKGVKSGTMHHELAEHLESCETCQEIVFVAQCLQGEIAPTIDTLRLPESGVVWRRAQQRARAKAIAKATFPIFVARVAAFLVAILGAMWFTAASPAVRYWISEIGLRMVETSNHLWPAVFSGSMLAGMMAGSICIGVSSWYVLRQD